jgi:hypothetical protein
MILTTLRRRSTLYLLVATIYLLLHGSTVYCSWPCLLHYILHGSAVYLFWRPCSHWAWVCPPQGWFRSNTLLKLQVVLRSWGPPDSISLRCLSRNLFVMNFGHHLPFWPHSLGGICYSWNGPSIISLQKILLTDIIFIMFMHTRAF